MFYLFKQILPFLSLYFTRIFRSGIISQVFNIDMNCVRKYVFYLPLISPIFQVLGRWLLLLWVLYLSLLLTWLWWGLIMRTHHSSGPVTLVYQMPFQRFSHWNWGCRLLPWGKSWEDVSLGTAGSLGSSLREKVLCGKWSLCSERGKTRLEKMAKYSVSIKHCFIVPHTIFFIFLLSSK